MVFLRILAVLGLFAFSTPVQAQFAPGMPTLCLGHLLPSTITGNYTFKTGKLKLVVAGNTMFPDPAGQGAAVITTSPDPLIQFVLGNMPAPMPDIPLVEIGPSDPTWELSLAPDINITTSDLEVTWGCALTNMPRLVGKFRTRSQDGFDIDNTMRLVVMEPDWLIGYWEFKSVGAPQPVTGIRSVELSR